MMTIEWQRLGSRLGHDTPPDILEAGMEGLWSGVMEYACEIHRRLWVPMLPSTCCLLPSTSGSSWR